MEPNILILDGGLGTSLIKDYNVKFSDSTPLWTSHMLLSDQAQQTLLDCQQGFGNVPVDIILTATYQVSLEAFTATITEGTPEGISPARGTQLLDDAVRIAETAKSRSARVALSVGPYGASMNPCQEYSGQYDDAHCSVQALELWHSQRQEIFARIPNLHDRISFVSFETIPRLDEIEAIRKSLDANLSLAKVPFWMACVFPGETLHLPDGHSIKDVVKSMLDPKIAKAIPWGIGINCTNVWKLDALLQQYESSVASLLEAGSIQEWPALVLYPDGVNGEVFNMEEMAWQMPAELVGVEKVPWEQQVADVVKSTEARGKWRQIVVGGCCQSNANDIKRLRQLLVKAE